MTGRGRVSMKLFATPWWAGFGSRVIIVRGPILLTEWCLLSRLWGCFTEEERWRHRANLRSPPAAGPGATVPACRGSGGDCNRPAHPWSDGPLVARNHPKTDQGAASADGACGTFWSFPKTTVTILLAFCAPPETWYSSHQKVKFFYL